MTSTAAASPDRERLREELAGNHDSICCRCHVCEGYPDKCDCGQRQRAVRIAALLAERDELARKVAAVREALDEPHAGQFDMRQAIRRALERYVKR